MNTFLHLDHIQRLHWNIIKSILLTLSLIPVVGLSHDLWFYSNQSEQLFLVFFGLSLFGTCLALAFISALKSTYAPTEQEIDEKHQIIVQYYQQIPMVFFTLMVVALTLQCVR